MTEKIRAPWTAEQVAALNRFQQEGGMHPFTCGNERHEMHVNLVAHADGWHCPDPECGYRQDWALAFMADPAAWLHTGIRGLLEHVGIDTTGKDITVGGEVVDPAPGEDLSGYYAPDPPIGCALPAPAPDTGLRERIAAALTTCQGGTTWGAMADAVMAVRDRELEQLRAELEALKAVARGYCPECGRGDCSPTADQWYEQWQRADRAEAAIARVRAVRDELDAGRTVGVIRQDIADRLTAALDGQPKEAATSWTPGPVALARAAEQARQQDAAFAALVQDGQQYQRCPQCGGTGACNGGPCPLIPGSTTSAVPAEPCRCSNGYECPHRCWNCKADRAAGCEEWCHIRPFDTEEASR